MNSTKWDIRFLQLAKHISDWSKDPSTKVGAVISDSKNRLVSFGYNGFPAGVEDNHRLQNRKTKYKIIVHAEANAILFANTELTGCTLYTYPFQPCSVCSGLIIQSGISRVVCPKSNIKRWKESFELSYELLNEAKIPISYYDMKQI